MRRKVVFYSNAFFLLLVVFIVWYSSVPKVHYIHGCILMRKQKAYEYGEYFLADPNNFNRICRIPLLSDQYSKVTNMSIHENDLWYIGSTKEDDVVLLKNNKPFFKVKNTGESCVMDQFAIYNNMIILTHSNMAYALDYKTGSVLYKYDKKDRKKKMVFFNMIPMFLNNRGEFVRASVNEFVIDTQLPCMKKKDNVIAFNTCTDEIILLYGQRVRFFNYETGTKRILETSDEEFGHRIYSAHPSGKFLLACHDVKFGYPYLIDTENGAVKFMSFKSKDNYIGITGFGNEFTNIEFEDIARFFDLPSKL